MTPQRIAYVLNIFPKVSETFIAGELAELSRRGVSLRILSLLPPRNEPQHEIIRRAGLDKLVDYDVSKFPDVVKSFKPELLHAHFAREATEKARELSALTGIPFTFTAHGYDLYRKAPPDFRARAEAALAVVTVSQANRDFIEKTFGVTREHVCVIPCGVDTERFCPDESQGRATLATVPLVVCVARHVAVKRLELLLEACALLRERGVRFRCVMVGDGPLRRKLEDKCAGLGLREIVAMPGAAEQAEVLWWWQRATVGVLTSDNEGMPVSLMEAAACGVPVVATRVGGVAELVADGTTGLLVPPGDAKAFAAAVERVLVDDHLRERMSVAARQRALEKFSMVRQVDALLELWRTALAGPRGSAAVRRRVAHDPFLAAADAELPTLALALNFARVREEFKHAFPALSRDGFTRPRAIRVVRHKPGKRAVVEYDVKLREHGVVTERLTLIGKLRAGRYGNEGFRLQEAVWSAGFHASSPDGISVPEPLGVIADFQMWFQRKVSGVTAEEILSKATKTDRIAFARRVAEAIHKLRCAGVPTEKRHTMVDELRILRECFDKVAVAKPEWADRLANVMAACEILGASVMPPKPCGIHRDFYPAQVIVESARLWLLDFDLYCLGDPGLDAGNFIGHVTEQALRERGDANALADVERALEDRFVELSGERVRVAVRAYTLLTLARHIFLSTRFPQRQRLTQTLLELCEERLANSNARR